MAESSSCISTSTHDVFISHRGPDVKKTFASHLYHRLISFGLEVFLDQEELQRGDYINSQIEKAIGAASVHVVIFSENYAGSTWCLNELVLMVDSKAPIIPVFYHVKPTELRWTEDKDNGVYAQDLHRLKNKMKYDPQTQQETPRHDSATIKQWRNALNIVAGVSGFELEACNGDEGILLEKVVESVLRDVKKPLHVAKHPTGLNEKLADLENTVLLEQNGRKPQVVGIVGLGGAGKTTLAKEFFNRKNSQYNRCCFLSDVRETVRKGSLISLQMNLLMKLTGSDLKINNKDEGIEMLKKHLSSNQILLILDDVDNVDQVDTLVPDQNSIHSNSLILITCRDSDVLTRSGVEKSLIYKLNGLNEQHSQELFCSHAFNQPYPVTEFEDLTEKFVNACDGLPLSLKVLGALLRGNRDMRYWHEQLRKLEKILPTEIRERLQISYEALDTQEKQIFLDIACFFIGKDKDTAIRIWNGSDWEGSLGFQTLQNKCLVELENRYLENQIHMHDHIRDLGRYLAWSSSPRRLWCWTENAMDDLLQQSSVITVRGIRMVRSEYHDYDEFDSIQMRKLQLVETEGILSEGILRRVKSPNLIWLCWKECPYSSLPSWIPMKNLRVLQVSSSTLETLWQQESELPLCLEELRVDECEQLKRIEGLGRLRKLHRLDVTLCIELEELPGLESLVSLEDFRASDCEKLKRIQGLAHCTKLRLLYVDGCSELEELPGLESLVSLEDFRASDCVKLKRIQGLPHCPKLRLLFVHGCSELEELPSMESLVSLEDFQAYKCVKLKRIQGLPHCPKLRLLNVHGCSELEELPSMESLVSLEDFQAYKCVKLKRIQGLPHCPKLRLLNVHGCSELEELPSMESLVSLEDFQAYKCVKLKRIQGLAHCPKLRLLNVHGCSELEELPSMESLVSLEDFCAYECVKLKRIQGLAHCTKLRMLFVGGCPELEELPSMESLVSLEAFIADECVRLKRIQGLAHCTKLRSLFVYGCSELEELPSMESLVSLEEFRAYECVKLKRIQGLAHCTKLRLLNVHGCSELEELPSMESLVSLKDFLAYECVKLKRIQGLAHCTKLRLLNVHGCSELEELPSMESLVSLKDFLAYECVKLKRIQGLAHCTKLWLLDVHGCSELEELPSMESLVSLQDFRAYECVKLKRIQGLAHCTNLRLLNVHGCSELEELPSMESLVSLEDFQAYKCVKLKRIQGLPHCLRLLAVDGCSELEELPSMESLVSLEEFRAYECVKLKRIQGLAHCTKLRLLNVL